MSAFYLRNFGVDDILKSRVSYGVFKLFEFVITFHLGSYLQKPL